MKMVGDSCKTSSKRIHIDVQSHLDLWSLLFTSFLQFLQFFFKVLFAFKSCCALLSLNSCHAWSFFSLESLSTCCVHKYPFVSKLVSCLELIWSRVSFNYLWSLSRGVRNFRKLMVIQRQKVHKIKMNEWFVWRNMCPHKKKRMKWIHGLIKLFLVNAQKRKCDF